MDRLPPVAVALAGALWAVGAAAGCKDDAAAPARRERVNAVKAGDRDRPAASDVCDRLHAPGQGPAFAWPELAGAPPPATGPTRASGAGTWRWINVWATWCKPCVAELPRLVRWQGELAERGIDVSLELLSADASDGDVAAFRASHPGTPASARVADVDALPAWIEPMGSSGAALPIHIFVEPGGRVRCVRASEVEDADYRAIEALLRDRG